MLVIRRRAGESLLIGDDVEIEILELSPAQVKIGIRAPRQVTILRKEVHLTRAQNRTASQGISSQVLTELLDKIGR
ncbi:MAG: carbon storage regulator [Bryobacteraceae bacterium]